MRHSQSVIKKYLSCSTTLFVVCKQDERMHIEREVFNIKIAQARDIQN